MDFTFTGLLTSATKALKTQSLKDVAYSLQETAFSMLCEPPKGHCFSNKKEVGAVWGSGAEQKASGDAWHQCAFSKSKILRGTERVQLRTTGR